jgi:PAS domain S-box-containing protein
MNDISTKIPAARVPYGAGELPDILLVDDQPARLLTYESILSGLNVHCVRASSGHEALQRLLAQEFAVIILDVNMPVMDGFEVARLVREHPRMERTPIIFVTGVHVSELDYLKGYEVGAIDYIPVPVVPEILRSKVAILVELYQRRNELRTLNEALAEARARLDQDHAAAIAASQTQLMAIFEHPTEAIVVLEAHRDVRGNIDDWIYRNANSNAIRNLGSSREAILGQRVSALEPMRAPAVIATCINVLSTGKFATYDLHYGGMDYAITIYPAGPERVVLSGYEITERRRTEAALEASERRYRALIEGAPVAVSHNALDGTFQYVNKAFCDLLGYSAEELCQKTWQEVTYPDDVSEDSRFADAVVAGQIPYYTLEKRYVRKDGSIVWVSLFGNFVLDERGNAQQGVAIVIDITQRRGADAALRESQQRLLLAQKAAQLGTHEYDPRTGTILWDARTCELWGVPPDVPVTYALWASAVHPEDIASTERALAEAMNPAGNGEFLSRYRVIHRTDGQTRWIEATGLVTFEKAGPVRLVGTVQDITERVEANAALIRSEERFRSIFQETGIGMVLLETDCTIRMANPAFCAIVGRQEQALVGRSCLSITHPEDVDSNFRLVRRLVDGSERSATFEKRYQRPDGSSRWVRINIVRQAAEGAERSEERLLAAVEDITERIEALSALEEAHREREHLLEAERTARTAAESAIRAKDEFLATLSHELRTPLSNVISWARVLQRKYASEHADLGKGLKIIVDNAMTQSQLIADLLDMSRIVAGKISLETNALDVADLVARAVTAQRPTAEAKGLTIEIEPAVDVAFVLGDETRLQQVLWNVLSNAIKFTPEGTQSPIRVRIWRAGSRYLITVTDPGEGIDAGFLPHIFGRFRQSDGSRARRHGGLGLGLAIVKQLVELHGGDVSVHSAGVGQGATFTISLLVYESDIRSPLPLVGEEVDLRDTQPLAGRTILVVEDQPSILEHLKQCLEEHGAATVCVSSAHEVVGVLRGSPSSEVELLLSDLGLPEMDGYQLIRVIREELGITAKALPAIAVSAFARDEDRARSMEDGYQAHIIKPYHVAQVVKMAATLLRNSSRNHLRLPERSA